MYHFKQIPGRSKVSRSDRVAVHASPSKSWIAKVQKEIEAAAAKRAGR